MRTLVDKKAGIYADVAQTYANDRRGHRAVFLVLRDEVAQLLHDGYSIRAVYTRLREVGRVTFSYRTFRLYVREYIPDHQRKQPSCPPSTERVDSARPVPGGGGRDWRDAPRPRAQPVAKGKPYVDRDPLEPHDPTKYP